MRPYSSPSFYVVFRTIFGLYLAVHFFMLMPYAWELFSNQGMIPRVQELPTYPFFPNLLFVMDQSWFVTGFLGLLGFLSLGLVTGKFPKLIPLLLWYGWACLVTRNVFIRNPGMPYVGWMLLAMPFIPQVNKNSNAQNWQIPKPLFTTAWILLAVGYTLSGIHKLSSPSWVDGTAILRLTENPISRPTIFSGLMAGMPVWFLKINAWFALFLEVSFAFFAIFKRTRPWIWFLLVGMHLNIMLVVDFVDLTFGMILIHLFTFDQRWVPPVIKQERFVVFFDGVCGMCNGFVNFLVMEGAQSQMKFAPIQGKTAQALNLVPQNQAITTIVVHSGDASYTESDAVIQILERLGGFWRILSLIKFIPKSIRDFGYRFISKHRYKVFGQRDACRLPSAEERQMFLE
jgi:predicted DCC family thiol-disulfide oxidoreductase YuxK